MTPNINTWIKEQDRIVAAQQKRPKPYYGAIGGSLTSHMIVKADGSAHIYYEHNVTHNRFDDDDRTPIDEFSQKNLDKVRKDGHDYDIAYTPTSLGCVTKITDLTDGTVYDLTDYADW